MKPKSPSIVDRNRTSFVFLPLYLTDLNYLIELSKIKNFKCKISDQENEYDDIEDLLVSCGKHIRTLSLTFTKVDDSFKDVSIDVSNSEVVLRSSKEDECIALEQRFLSYLKARVPWYALLLRQLPWFLGSIGCIPIVFAQRSKPVGESYFPYVSILCGICGVMCLISVAVPYFWGGVYLQKKHEVLGFWGKYDKVFIAVISSIVTLIGTWAIKNLS